MSLCGIPLLFGHLEDEVGLTPQEKTQIRHADQAFQTMDRRVLYALVIILTINIFVLLGLLKDEDSTLVLVECSIMAVIALVFAAIRIWAFKYHLLHPVLALWRRAESDSTDRLFFGLFIFFSILAIIMMMIGAIFLTSEKYTAGIGLTIGTCLTFIFASLVYRLHAGTFIRWAQTHPIRTSDPPSTRVVVNGDIHGGSAFCG